MGGSRGQFDDKGWFAWPPKLQAVAFPDARNCTLSGRDGGRHCPHEAGCRFCGRTCRPTHASQLRFVGAEGATACTCASLQHL